MRRRFFLKSRQAQQLVEFAIVVPILMIIIFIVVEFGAAINARLTVSEAVKMSLMEVNKLNSINGDTATKEAFVSDFIKNKVIEYLIMHNIPNSGSISAKVKYNATSNTAVAFVYYEYTPYFLLAGMAGSNFSAIPFSSSQTVNPHIFQSNNVPVTPTTEHLSKFFTDGAGNFIDSGALVDTTPYNYDPASAFNVREHIAFLLRLYEGPGTHPSLEYDIAHARLVDWVGNDLLPPNLRVNLRTGTLEARSPYYQPGGWFNTNIPYVWVASAMGFTHLIYVKYNTDLLFISEGANPNFRLRFNDTNLFYTKRILFCGTGGTTGLCEGDQRDTASVNERALRMNPRLGDFPTTPWNDSYIMGATEPVIITNNSGTVLTDHDFQHVNGFYFSYTTAYNSWGAGNWDNQYFISTQSPQVMTMADSIYHTNQSDVAINPFYRPYMYRFRLFEHDQGANAGVYDSSATAVFANDEDPDNGDGNNFFQVDIIDVYIDSDGDGISDAWDRDPEYFDVNINGNLDGNELGVLVDFWNLANKCGNGGTSINCPSFSDDITAAGLPAFYASGTNRYIISTPYQSNDPIEPSRTARYLPLFKDAMFVTYDNAGNKALYYDVDGTNYTRKYPTWWEHAGSAAARRAIKKDFIHGAESGQDLALDPSPEFDYLKNSNTFSNSSYVTRTPPTVWP